jgi:hypothetical protein
VGLRAVLEAVVKEKNSQPLPGFEHPDHPPVAQRYPNNSDHYTNYIRVHGIMIMFLVRVNGDKSTQ